jgi:hypothetical protein
MSFLDDDLEAILENSLIAESFIFDPGDLDFELKVFLNKPQREHTFDRGNPGAQNNAIVQDRSITFLSSLLPRSPKIGDIFESSEGQFYARKILHDGKNLMTVFLRHHEPKDGEE